MGEAKKSPMYKTRSIACVIPARLGSSRFPNKAVAKIKGRELVLRVADIASKSKHVDTVIVATEDQAIKDLANENEYLSIITGSRRRRQPQSPATGEIQAPSRSHDAAAGTGRVYPETA